MKSSNDGTVSRGRITEIMVRARTTGWQGIFDVLQHQEPVLAAYALAMADLVAERLREGGTPDRIVRFVHREMVTAELVSIQAMRQASRELWKDFLPDAEPETKP
jgi:hypothetical protein